jgi:hypothetical protein
MKPMINAPICPNIVQRTKLRRLLENQARRSEILTLIGAMGRIFLGTQLAIY